MYLYRVYSVELSASALLSRFVKYSARSSKTWMIPTVKEWHSNFRISTPRVLRLTGAYFLSIDRYR